MPVSSSPLWPLLPKSHFDSCHHYCSTSEIMDLNIPLSDNNFLNFPLVWEIAPSASFFHLNRTSQKLVTRLSLNLANLLVFTSLSIAQIPCPISNTPFYVPQCPILGPSLTLTLKKNKKNKKQFNELHYTSSSYICPGN